MSNDVLHQLHTLKDQAQTQSAQIAEQLQQGTPPDKLVSLLQTQAETVRKLQESITSFAQSEEAQNHPTDIKQLQQALKALALSAQQNVQQATQKGVRLTGIGGKPYIPRRKPR